MMTDPLRTVSDATIVLAGVWCLVGYVLGFVTALVIWWRPIRRRQSNRAEARLYRLALLDVEQRERDLRSQNTALAQKLTATAAELRRQRVA